MTESEKIRALVSYRIEQAEEALRSARLNLDSGLLRSASNRSYYAMFYAVLALLATRKEETSRHSGAISRFDQHFVKTGMLPREFSRWLHAAFAQRQDADYSAGFSRSVSEVSELVDQARTFVTGVRNHLRSLNLLSTSDQPGP